MRDGQILRHALALLTAAATLVLIVVGGLVTSTGSGLAVPDWPLSFGGFLPPMVGGVLYEHGHRMIAAAVALLTLLLAISIAVGERRPWPRRLAAAAIAALILQILLGGITVLLHLPVAISVSHACLGQIFLGLIVALALVTSPSWSAAEARPTDSRGPSLRALSLWMCAATFAQLLAGAVVRHMGAGLAIPDFPLAFGRVLPPVWTAPVTVHFLHRVGALVVVASALWILWRVHAQRIRDTSLRGPALALVGLLIVQICLGALTIWTGRAVWAATAHVGVGAAVLACAVMLAAGARRLGVPRTAVAPRQPAAAQATA